MGEVGSPRPLNESDDREAFDCGRDALNYWFRRHAWHSHKNGGSRVTVICDERSRHIMGFVTLSASQVTRAYLPKQAQRNMPDPVPVVLLGQLAVDLQYNGQGVAASLLKVAFKTAIHISSEIGCVGVVTHPLDDSVRDFYARFGFQKMALDPKGSMIVRIVELQRNGL